MSDAPMPEAPDPRYVIACAFVQLGVDDDDGPGLYEWNPCVDQPACPAAKNAAALCACSGRPYLSDDVWAAITDGLAGRLLPEGGETRTEWIVTGDITRRPDPFATKTSVSLAAARAALDEWRDHFVNPVLWSREACIWPDGSRYVGPWVAVDQDGLLTRDELVAKLDAEPDPEEKNDA